MDKMYALRSIFCLLSLISSASSAFKPIFGPPKVTLQCSADYVNLNKVVGVSWLPTLLSNETSISTQTVNNRVQNCEAGITCSGGYNKPPIGCTYNTTTGLYLLKWEFSVPFHETSCSVQVSYLDHEDYHGTVHMTRKSCSYSAPNSTIFKKSSPVSATVGKPYWIQCSVHTSEKVNSSVVKIDWSGPDGPITNDSRITVHPTLSDDEIVHNSTLQFVYLSQNDNGTFTCNMTILDTNISEAFQLNKITIPTPNISVTALSNQTLNNNSLMLECNITTVRGITSNMDIVWMANNTIIRRMNDSLGKLINNVITHRDVCHVSNVGSDGTQYHCHAVINESLIAKGSFFSTKPSVSVPSPMMTSTSPTASMYTVSNSFIPTETSTANSSTENSSTENPPSATAKTSAALAGTAQVAIIISVVIGFLIISFLICVIVYKFKRELYSKNHYSTNNSCDIHFKAPSISDVRYSITDKDDASTCENLDLNDKVVGWMKSLQGPDLNEQCDESYPSNEEILNYVCGHNLKYCDSRQANNENVEYKKLSKAEEGLLVPSNHSPMTNNGSILRIGEKTMSDHDVSVFYDKGSSQNIQTVTNNKTEKDHALSTSTVVSQNKPYVTLNTNTKLIPDKVCILHNTSCHCRCKYDYSEQHDDVMLPVVEQVNHSLAQQGENLSEQKEAHKAMLHACNDERTISMHMANSDQLSLDSSSKLTEETLTSSVSSCSINISLAGGEYIENGSPSHRAIISCIPIQSPTNFHQNNVKHFDGNKCLTSTAIEGEYVDRNIAVQQSKHTTNKN